MNLKEVSQLLAIIKEVYPNYIKDSANIPVITKMWHRQLADYDVKIVTAGLDAFIAKDTKGFAPVPGQLLAEIRKIMGHVKQERYLTHMEAWEKVREVMSGATCYHKPDKAFKSLPEYIQQVVGSASTLVKWSVMDTERLETVIMPNFRDSYKGIVEDRKSRAMLPSSVVAMIEDMGAKQIKNNSMVIPFKRIDGSTISGKETL